MKLANKKAQRQKEIRRIRKRRTQIWKAQKELGYIPLEKPIRHGWFKELVITTHVERYKNQEYILEVYKKLAKCFWGRTKEEAETKWSNETSKYLINKEVPTLSRRQYNRLSDGAKRLCVPFYYYTEKRKLKLRFYVNLPKGTYKIKFTRAYVTHSKRIDPTLESEEALLEQKLLKNEYYAANLKGDTWKNNWQISESRKEKLKVNTRLRELTKYSTRAIINEEITWERN
ncbi:hypothetical protein [Aquimarina algicola]|uniref:Uncharacterized protein n=1 Tax=Aquimarina algicola TaxID=2589995 RepID=A0A504J7V5_9FLAO|nr:hypothetical protein [Aquimarina algicola]TPN86946.1 hypothetical protein FHK87_04910 [Aquimarina algicola]